MRPLTNFALCASLAALNACGYAVVEGSLGGTSSGPELFYEREPNDSAAGPDYLTALYAGDAIEIVGHVDDGCCDPFDGFAIDVGEALELQFELVAHDGWSDLDLCVYDPQADVFLACFEAPGDVEFGSVAIGWPAELHLVVRSWSGASDYSLFVDAYALAGSYLAQSAPADPSHGFWAYSESTPAEFELRVEELPHSDPDEPRVGRVILRR